MEAEAEKEEKHLVFNSSGSYRIEQSKSLQKRELKVVFTSHLSYEVKTFTMVSARRTVCH